MALSQTATTATYLAAALLGLFLTQLGFILYGERNGSGTNSRLSYFIFGSFFGIISFYVVLLALPQVWPIATGGG